MQFDASSIPRVAMPNEISGVADLIVPKLEEYFGEKRAGMARAWVNECASDRAQLWSYGAGDWAISQMVTDLAGCRFIQIVAASSGHTKSLIDAVEQFGLVFGCRRLLLCQLGHKASDEVQAQGFHLIESVYGKSIGGEVH